MTLIICAVQHNDKMLMWGLKNTLGGSALENFGCFSPRDFLGKFVCRGGAHTTLQPEGDEGGSGFAIVATKGGGGLVVCNVALLLKLGILKRPSLVVTPKGTITIQSVILHVVTTV